MPRIAGARVTSPQPAGERTSRGRAASDVTSLGLATSDVEGLAPTREATNTASRRRRAAAERVVTCAEAPCRRAESWNARARSIFTWNGFFKNNFLARCRFDCFGIGLASALLASVHRH